MRVRFPLYACLAYLLAAAWLNPPRAWADSNTAAVLSEDMQPYQQALAGFEQVAGAPGSVAILKKGTLKLNGEPKIVAAFGGRAARQRYPESSVLIYGLAPGTSLSASDHRGTVIGVGITPDPKTTLINLQRLHPGLRRLAVLWTSPSYASYVSGLVDVGRGMNIEVIQEPVRDTQRLPAYLRSLDKSVNALWLLPDPLLVTPDNLFVITNFSIANRVPLFSAIDGLAEKGAVATMVVPYSEIGRTMGQVALDVRKNAFLPDMVFPSASVITLNESSAREMGLPVSKNAGDGINRISP